MEEQVGNKITIEEKKVEETKTEETKPKIDWKKFLFSKKWLLLILIPLIITFMVRLEPMKLKPMERSTESNARDYFRSQMIAKINEQYPNIPDEEKNKLADEQFNNWYNKDGKKIVDEAIKTNSDALKSRLQYESGGRTYVYLGDIDSYYWLRMARNIIEKGTQCDVIKDGICYDSYTTAPNLAEKDIDYYPIAIVFVYKMIKPFNPDISIMQASFYTPLFFSLLLTIPLFLLLRKIGGNFAAIVGSVLVNVNPFVLSRSLGSDSDIVNVFFQALFLWLAIEAFYAKTARAKYIWSFIVGFALAFYSKFWSGWWYLADLFILSLVLAALYLIIKDWYAEKKIRINELKKPIKEIGIMIGLMIVSVIIFYGIIFSSFANLISVVQDQFNVVKFKVAANPNLWPNVLTTVAEFNSIALPSIISSFGEIWNIPVFLMAILGTIFLIFPSVSFINKNLVMFILLLIIDIFLYFNLKSSTNGLLVFLILIPVTIGMYAHIKAKEETGFHPEVIFLLVIIICLVVYFTMTGMRFIFLMAIPISIFSSLFFAKITTIIISTIRKILNLPKIVVPIAMLIIIFFFLNNPVRAGFDTAQNYMPNVNDGWVSTLEKIKQESKPDAIINSWWDFGHWFKYLADRRVTLDGSSQNNPQLHWLGKLLLASDENQSKGVLRMLDCGGNKAFDAINEKLNDTPHAINVLNSIIVEKNEDAKKILLKHNFTDQEIENVLQYSHCDPPEDFLITSQDMIGKAGVWAHFGSWNFQRAYVDSVIDKVPETEIVRKLKDDYDVSEDTARGWINERKSLQNQESINTWIAPWPTYYNIGQACEQRGDTAICIFSQGSNQIPATVDFVNKDAFILKSDGTKAYPETFALVTNEGFYLTKNQKDTLPFGMAVLKSENAVNAIYMSPELTGSMFTRLFFFEGVGLKSFTKFHDTTSVFGERIITWKVVWEKD